MISTKKPDDEGDEARKLDSFEQKPEQKAAIAHGGEEAGRPEPKSEADWAERGAEGGTPGRPPVALGGSSQGQADRMPAGGATGSNPRAGDPATKPGHKHDA